MKVLRHTLFVGLTTILCCLFFFGSAVRAMNEEESATMHVSAFSQMDKVKEADDLFSSRQFEAALKKYEEILNSPATLSTYRSQALFMHAECLGKLGKIDEAIAEFEKMKFDHSSPLNKWFDVEKDVSLSSLLLKKNQPRLAVEKLQECLKQMPGVTPACDEGRVYYLLGKAYEMENDTKKALEYYQKAAQYKSNGHYHEKALERIKALEK